MKSIAIALLGAVIGGVLGHFAFLWIVQQGFSALILPGAMIGFGASFGKAEPVAVPIACAVAALLLGFFSEWRAFPFVKDGSLDYFVRNISKLKPITLIMIGIGGFVGFWIPFRWRAVRLG